MTLTELLSDLRFISTRSGYSHPTRPELTRTRALDDDGAHLVELGWAEREGRYLRVTDAGLDVLEACRVFTIQGEMF